MPNDPGRGRLVLRLGAVALIAATALPPMALADPAPPFTQLLRQAEGDSPRLAEAVAGVRQAQGLARQARVRPNPTVSLEAENFAGAGPYRDFGGAEITASVAQAFELGGKRPARIAAGEAEVEAARARQAETRGAFAADLANLYARAEAAQIRLANARQALALAGEEARAAKALVEAGREPDLRRVQADAALGAARADVEAVRAECDRSFAELTALAGGGAPITAIPVSLLVHADRTEIFAPPDPTQAPAYRRALVERDAAERRVRVEETRATPDLTLSFGARRLNGDRSTALVAGGSIPLPLFDRNRGNVSAAQAELSAAQARARAALLDADAESRAAASQANAAQERMAAARQAEAAADEAYRLTLLGYEGGKLPLLELTAARRALVDARNQTLTARIDRLNAEAALARLRGATPFGDAQ